MIVCAARDDFESELGIIQQLIVSHCHKPALHIQQEFRLRRFKQGNCNTCNESNCEGLPDILEKLPCQCVLKEACVKISLRHEVLEVFYELLW